MSRLLAHYWLLQSLSLESVFWTGFRQGAWLYAAGFVGFFLACAVPGWTHELSSNARRSRTELSILARRSPGTCSRPTGRASCSPADTGSRSARPIRSSARTSASTSTTSTISGPAGDTPSGPRWCSWPTRSGTPGERRSARPGTTDLAGVRYFFAVIGTKTTQAALGLWGAIAAAGVWLSRYDLLFKDNSASSVWTGAQAIDVTGFFSNLNYIYLTTILMFVDDVVVILMLRALNRNYRGEESREVRSPLRALAYTYLLLLAIDFSFKGLVEVRNWVAIKPNEPVVQLPFIQRNLDATRAAFMLDRVKEIELRPKTAGDPPANLEALLASESLRQAPLWPGFSSYLERHLDIQHANRIFQTNGDPMIYGPTLEVFRQQQQLRTYYDFVGVDTVRYSVDGKKKLYVSAVREAPLWEPSPWLAYWGQRFLLFTHGFGLVAAPVAERDPSGAPHYASYNIPAVVDSPALAHREPPHLLRRGLGDDGLLEHRPDEGARLPERPRQGRDRAAGRLPGWRQGRQLPEAPRTRLAERSLLRDRLQRPHPGHDAHPLLPHAARAPESGGAVPLLRPQRLRGRGRGEDPVDRQRSLGLAQLSLFVAGRARRQVRQPLAVREGGADGQLHRRLGQGDGRCLHRRDPALQAHPGPADLDLGADLPGALRRRVDDAGLDPQTADLSDAPLPHPVRRSLHLLPPERPDVLLQHGRHVGRR